MSLFKTTFKVDLEEFKTRLPDRAMVTGVRYDKKAAAIEVLWDDPNERTGYTFAVEREPDAPLQSAKTESQPEVEAEPKEPKKRGRPRKTEEDG